MRAWHLEQGVRVFRWQLRKLELLSSASALVLTLGYLMLMFHDGVIEAIALAGCLVASVIVTGMIAEGGRRRRTGPIFRVLSEDSCGVVAGSTAVDVSSAFGAVVSLPQEMQRIQFLACLPSIFIVPLLLWAMGFEAWFSVGRIRSLALIVFVSSLMGGVFRFYWAKQCLTELRAALALLAGDSVARASLIRRVSLRRKLLLVVVLPAFSGAVLVVDVVHENMRTAAEKRVTQWATIAVESIENADAELPLAAGASGSFADALGRRLELGETAGVVIPTSGPEIGAFRRLEDGTVLVSKVLRSDFEAQISAVYWAVGLVCLGVLGVAVLIGRLAAGEISDGLEALEATAERMAAGDLAAGVDYESEDELGELGRALASVGDMVRVTATRVSSTAEETERIAEEIFAALADVAATNVNQKDQLRQAGQVIAMVAARTSEATRSATNLSSTIEESGASLLQLGATGDELNETASLLTSKVSAVSESLEQMVRSVEQVVGTSERLAAASEETSSSMEEMASAMRAVDTSAETTAKLSREVVSKAELGQAKVVQTIQGMEAIREATDVAEKVIRGLGTRTSEIGGILDVIDDVADETNLLALNAAIIAAQAGEHGKAFSVVADEIKELADRVLASTKEIGSLIRAVQDESENAIGAIEAGSASVMSGVDLSAEAGRTLEEITVSSRESGLRIGEIVASVREQTKAASHVVGLMERVKESAEEIGAAGSQQSQGNEIVYQSAMTMREVAQQVRNTAEEQAAGFSRMRENVVGVREAVDQIAGSLAEQAGACSRVTESLGLVSQGTRSNEEALEKLRGAMREFVSNSATLREDAERFRV